MLNNNEECNWSDFLDEPLAFSLATLSKYMNLLMRNGFVGKKEKGIYKITPEGRKRYFDLRFKDSFDKKLRYPPEIILNKRNYDHIILWMLYNNEYCNWKDFLEKPLLINHNSLSKYLKFLLEKGYVKNENNEYKITETGESQYSKVLKKYELDYQSILKEEIRRLEEIKEKATAFLENHEIDNDEVKIIFLDLINHLDYSKSEKLLSSQDDYYKIILFLSINHPILYPEYISPKDFSLNFAININTLNFFIQKIIDENLYGIKFFNLNFGRNCNYFFRVDEKFEKMLNLIIDENIVKFSFLHKLQPNTPDDEKNIQTISLIVNIAEDLYNKLFNQEVKSYIVEFLPKYINYLYGNFKRRDYSNNVIETFKGMVYENIINLDWDKYYPIILKKGLVSSLLNEYPKYTILDELKKILKDQ
ncbi:MAG: winged helix-turn-helix domain-containing protein [Promethearchaeota archaeon]